MVEEASQPVINVSYVARKYFTGSGSWRATYLRTNPLLAHAVVGEAKSPAKNLA